MIGGSAGIGLETARRARAEGADVILTGRNPERLEQAAAEVGATSTAAFDATDPAALDRFFGDLPGQIDHVMVTGPGPYYAPLAELDREQAHRDFDDHSGWPSPSPSTPSAGCGPAARCCSWAAPAAAAGAGLSHDRGGHRRDARPGRQPGGRDRADPGQPHRGRLRRHAAVRPLLGDDLEARRDQLRATLPIGRVVGPEDVAALAVHLMSNTALTGATYDIDGGQQLV